MNRIPACRTYSLPYLQPTAYSLQPTAYSLQPSTQLPVHFPQYDIYASECGDKVRNQVVACDLTQDL